MLKPLLLITAIFFTAQTSARLDTLPEEFADFGLDSDLTISYSDLDQLLKITVIDLGRSDRDFRKGQSGIGTRTRAHKNNDTALEANRFYYEEVVKAHLKTALKKIRLSLEQVPEQIPLNELVLSEQLAYWLNLYTTALLEKLIEHYPIFSTEDLLFGDNSLLDEEFITVMGHSLSLNDIQHNIVFKKFGKNKPIVMYGFHQGNIGSPNLRPEAYVGSKVYYQLADNGEEFVNSNRGMQIKGKDRLYLSVYYQQTEALFDDFEQDLKSHIEHYTNGSLKDAVESSKGFKLTIDDWHIVDLYRTHRAYGASSAINRAALEGIGGMTYGYRAADGSYITDPLTKRLAQFGRYPPQVWKKIRKLYKQRERIKGTVEIKDLDVNQE